MGLAEGRRGVQGLEDVMSEQRWKEPSLLGMENRSLLGI